MSTFLRFRGRLNARLLHCGILALLFLFATLNADDYGTWSNWRYVYLITNSNGAEVTGSTVTNFPVLIRFNPSNFDGLGSTSNSGADIRFAKTDGTHFPYAIERWTNYSTTNDTAEIWVLVDTIKPNDTTKIIMYWNRGGAVDSSSSEKVFSTSYGFQGVWHLGDSSGNVIDATNNSYDGTINGNQYRTAGRVAHAESYDGSGDYSEMANVLNMDYTSATTSFWVKRASIGSNQTIVAKSNGGNPNSIYGFVFSIDNANCVHMYMASGGSAWGDAGTFNIKSNSTVTDLTNWHYVVVTTDRSSSGNCKVYIDGADATGSYFGDITTVGNVTNSLNLRIASESDNEWQWNGSIDEVRLESAVHTADWVKLCYQNQLWSGGKDNFTRFSSSYWHPARYTWDTDGGTAGYQGGSGIWSTSTYTNWSQNSGKTRVVWPGPGNTANFAGSDGNYTINVDAIQYADSIAFDNDGYRITGGTALYVAKKITGAIFGFSPPYALGVDSAKAFDGNISTYCDDVSAGTGHTGIDLGPGNAQQIAYIRYYPRSSFLSRMKNGKFQGSNDAGSWTDLYIISSDPALDWQTVTVSNTTAWRYLRYLSPANGYCNVGEVEFYGMGSINVASGKYDTIATVLAGNSGIRKYGSGYLTLTGNNSYSGLTTVNAGTLRMTGTPTSNTRKFVINSGGTISVIERSNLSPNPAGTTADWITLNGGILSTGGTSWKNYESNRGFTLGTLGGTIEVPFSTDTVLLYGVITGSGGLTKTGNGALALIAANTFTGEVIVNGGILGTINAAALGNSVNTITVNNGGCINVYGTNLQAYTNAIVINGQVSSSTGALSNTGSNQESAFRKIALGSDASIGCDGGRFDIGRGYEGTVCVSGNGHSLTKVGTNIVALLGEGINIGSVIVNAGTLRLEKNNAVGTAPITINSGGKVNTWWNLTFTNNITLNGGTLASAESNLYSSNWSGAISITSASILLSSANNTTTLSGAITGSGSLINTGSEGCFIVSGNSNTFSGGTTISGGTLRITNTSGSATGTGTVTVLSGGTLEGTGSASGAATIGGTLSPGVNGPGSVTLGSSIDFSNEASFRVQINGITAGSGYDQLIMSSGTLSLGSATLSLTLGYRPSINDTFTIIDNQGSAGVSGTFQGLAQGAITTVSYNGVPYDCQISYTGGTGNDVVVMVLRVSAEDYANDWGYSQTILLNTTSTGADVSENVLNFPVLLRLNPGNFDGFANVQPGGSDIRIAKTNGAKLYYEIERWKDYDNDADTAEIWVRLDTVYGNNKTQSFVIYYGKSDAADSSNSAKVFDTANGFVGVWHLGETGNNNTDGYADASFNAAHAKGNNLSSGSEVSAIIGGGQKLNRGLSQCLTVTDVSESNFDIRSAITLSAWVNIASWEIDWQAIITKGDNSWRIHRYNWNGQLIFTCNGLSSNEGLIGTSNLSTGSNTWYYITGVYNGSKLFMYLNGRNDASPVDASGPINVNDYNVMIGENAQATGRNFNGSIDEVRVEKVGRDSSWVKLCYENQKTNQTLLSYEDYTTWGFSRNIIINTSEITTTNCIGFPLLVRLTSTNFDFNQARDSGQDIRFTKSNGIRLPYQIERWNKSSSLAEIWVKVDTVYGNDSTQYIKIYWGKSDVASKSNGGYVFDTANGYRGVWHFSTTGTGSRLDATFKANNAETNDATYSNNGVIAGCDVFVSESKQYDSVASGGINIPGKSFTVMAWAKMGNAAPSTFYGILGQGTNSTDQGLHLGYRGSASKYSFAFYYDDLDQANTFTGGTSWHLVAGTFNTTNKLQTLYLDGTYDNSRPAGNNYSGTGVFRIGNTYNGTGNYFGGSIDEVTVAEGVRSDDWIKLCYETQKPSPTIITSDSADAFRPLGIRSYGTSSVPDSIYVGTNRWALRFSKNKGGGVNFLAADSSSPNQLDANLFYLVYKGCTSDTGTGNISLLDSSIVFSRIRQTKNVAGLPFVIDYTVVGSGKMYVKVSTVAQSSLSGGLTFRIANNATASFRNIAFGSTAADCDGIAHIDSTSGKFDLIMAPFDRWSDADQIENNSKYTGLSGTSWNPPAGKRFVWELMIDFGHKTITDSSKIYRYIEDYRNSDTLGFIAGSPHLEQAWEEEENGEWQFNEGAGCSVLDNTGRGHTATISGTPSWTSGKWNSNAVYLTGSDSVTVPHSTDFNNTNQQQTITAWLRPDALLSSSVTILKKYASSGIGYTFTGGASGTLRYTMSNSGSVTQLQSSQVLTPGSWYHVAATMYMLGQSDYLALYINGKLDTVRNVELDQYFGTNTNNVVIGENFYGGVDDVRFYNQLLTEEEIRTIYLRGFSPECGMYRLRANNDNTIHCWMHGAVNNRFFPVMQISNYWATALPSYVYVDGVGLVSGIDYYAALDDNRNQLTIGFNRTINRASTIFVDNNMLTGQKENGPTKKMYWGISGSSNEYFWVKNTSGRYFGAPSANEFYINWKMNTLSIKDGEIWQMRSSVTNPYTFIDTATGTNLIQGTDGSNTTLGTYTFTFDGSNFPQTATNVTNNFTYTVEESSMVRVRLRINERQVSLGGSFNIVSRWTLYPSGQFFRYDSIYSFSGNPQRVYAAVFLDDQTCEKYQTNSRDQSKKRGVIIYSEKYPDFVTSWLAMKNSNGFQAEPFDDGEKIAFYYEGTRLGFDYLQASSIPAKWNSSLLPVQTVYNIDIHHTGMNTSSMDSIANGVQCTRFSTGPALSMITGTIDSTTHGDFSDGSISGGDNNGDGFNEMEGAYIVNASDNTVAFTLPAHSDTCRFYPAFRIKNYTAVNRPKYVFLFNRVISGDTVAILEGYQFNSYVNIATHELILQVDSVFCDSIGIYISSDKTLAVKLSKFEALPGTSSDTIIWRTESEQGNLGFQLQRRIKPEFYDSIANILNDNIFSDKQQYDSDDVISLFKRNAVCAADTGWVVINKGLIPGAPSGNSQGPRDYRFIDRNLFNGIRFEYRLIAIDEKQNQTTHGPVAVMPRRIVPALFTLGANYPNPFVRSTVIRFTLPVESNVSLKIFTLQGRLVRYLIKPDQKYATDYHQVFWDGKDDYGQQCTAGPLIYTLETGKYSKARVMLMLQ